MMTNITMVYNAAKHPESTIEYCGRPVFKEQLTEYGHPAQDNRPHLAYYDTTHNLSFTTVGDYWVGIAYGGYAEPISTWLLTNEPINTPLKLEGIVHDYLSDYMRPI